MKTLEELKATGVCTICNKPKHDGECTMDVITEGEDIGMIKNPFVGQMVEGKCQSCGVQTVLVWNFLWECDSCRYIHR